MAAGQVAERPVVPRLGAALYRETEGHPLFVIEAVRAGLGQRSEGDEAEAAAYGLPERVRQDLQVLPMLSKGHYVADLVAIIGSIDIVLGGLLATMRVTEDELVSDFRRCKKE